MRYVLLITSPAAAAALAAELAAVEAVKPAITPELRGHAEQTEIYDARCGNVCVFFCPLLCTNFPGGGCKVYSLTGVARERMCGCCCRCCFGPKYTFFVDKSYPRTHLIGFNVSPRFNTISRSAHYRIKSSRAHGKQYVQSYCQLIGFIRWVFIKQIYVSKYPHTLSFERATKQTTQQQ